MPTQPGMIVLMGSGELTATMVEVHKFLVRRYGAGANAVFLDTPAGFQLNADQISEKAAEYFETRVQHPLQVASFKSARDRDGLTAEKAYATLRRADYVLIGPGSPTYAVEQLSQSPIPDILHQRIEGGGCLVSASAAALTMGRLTLPVYEIYKVGRPVQWMEGLDILGHFGFNLVVIPHWNNADGGNHDTRFCFMGERRLQQLEARIPDATPILGLDEHTALIIDLARQETAIRGIGNVTLRAEGRETVFTRQNSIPYEWLKDASAAVGEAPEPAPEPREHPDAPAAVSHATSDHLQALAEQVRASIDNGLPEQATAHLLEMERTMWSAHDELEGDMPADAARDLFREMLLSLGNLCADRPADAETCVAPVAEALLALRDTFRSRKKWDDADAVRDAMARAGILVEDTAQGAKWRLGS